VLTWKGSSKMSRRLAWVWFVLVLALLAMTLQAAFIPVRAQTDTPLVIVLTVDEAVAPPMVEYLKRGLNRADQQGAELVIVQLNTPGGSLDSMNEVIQLIRNSQVPVVVYVAPSGAMAGSAGTMVTLAGHAAAMAPNTTIGAASPVGSQGEDLGQTMQAKEKNILKATVRTLAQRRSQQAIALAEQTIENAAAASAEEALAAGMVDFIAADIPDLLRQLDGFKVEINGGEQTLETTDARVETVSESFIEKLLAVLTNSAIVFLLITIGVQAILIEISSPGGWVAGFIGVVCLALAAYGLGVLPVNWFGLVFLIVAFVLFILDIKAPTHGALTAAGTVSLIVGALVMFNSPNVPSFQRVPVPLIIGASLSTGLIFFAIMLIGVRAQKAPVSMGMESLVGRVGTARTDLTPRGQVLLASELWTAELIDGEGSVSAGDRVEVVNLDGLRLLVRKAPL
jgi:membrane-bound serine protease (ClpP class)